jgi:hypothetical protein
VAIDVLLAFNLAVVFILMYFRFRVSRAKSIGNVLTNRQNAANCCLHGEGNKSAEELRIGLRCANLLTQQCIIAPIGNGVQICSSIIFKFYFADFFSGRRASPNDAG